MKHKYANGPPKRFVAVLLALLLVLAALPASVLAAGGITVGRYEGYSFTAGGSIDVPLNQLFKDTSGHKLTYAWSAPAGEDFTLQSKISGTAFHMCVQEPGTYHPTFTASCSQCGTASYTATIVVDPAPDGLPVQYNYRQTIASSVTVFVTISSDGVPILGRDSNQTVLNHLAVTVPYFDLDLYELSDFYRYETAEEGGGYIGDEVIRRPTAMHLFIYMLERYCLGYPANECGRGLHNPQQERVLASAIKNMWGEDAYSKTYNGDALYYTGGATSTYMQQFWGHDENLMYYRNHAYPLMSPGWGSTSDYILLTDGDTMDLAMYSDWGFYQSGGFLCIGDTEIGVQDTIYVDSAGSFTTSVLTFGTQAVAQGGIDDFVPYKQGVGLAEILDSTGEIEKYCDVIEEDDGTVTISFDFGAEHLSDGVYTLLVMESSAGCYDADNQAEDNPRFAPATATIVVGSCSHARQSCSYEGDEHGHHTKTTWCVDCRVTLNTVTENCQGDTLSKVTSWDNKGHVKDNYMRCARCSYDTFLETVSERHVANSYQVCEICCQPISQVVGDVSGDDVFDSSDLSLLNRFLLNANHRMKVNLADNQIQNADVNGDGEVNSTDASLIARSLLPESHKLYKPLA